MEYPIDTEKQGLFVIIKQLSHNVIYHPTCENAFDWGKVPELHYTADENSILHAFNLHKDDENVVADENLTNITENNSFDSFMEKVKEKCKEKKGSLQFVMVFLMSHGFANGDFLLASSGDQTTDEVKSYGPCCTHRSDKKHDLEGSCFGRNFVKHVMEKVCEHVDAAVPKVFVNQTCRGPTDYDLVPVGAADDERNTKPSDTELFLPPSLPSVFLFWACVEGSASQVSSTGSILVENFCKALQELKDADANFGFLIEKVTSGSRQNSNLSAEVLECLKNRELCTGGWIMNVCQRTTTLATNKMLVEVILPSSNLLGELLARPGSDLKQDQPTFNDWWRALQEHKNTSRYPRMVQKVIDKCSTHGWALLYYLWTNVRLCNAQGYLKEIKDEGERLELKEALDGITTEIADVKPISKQQPHISSNLWGKLSLVKILQTQRAKNA